MQWVSNHVDQNHRWKKLSFHEVFTNLYQVSLWLSGTTVSTVVWRFHFKMKPAKQPVVQMGSSAPLHLPFLQHLFDLAVTSSGNQTGNPQKMNSFVLVRFPKPARCGVRQALEPAQRRRWDHMCERSRKKCPFGPSFSLDWLTSWRHTLRKPLSFHKCSFVKHVMIWKCVL